MAKINIGDIVEIKTDTGFAYALFTHAHKQYGALLRVCNRIIKEKPASINFRDSTSFSCFFPLKAAVDRRIVSIVGNIPVPPHLQEFPIFRAGVVDPDTGRVAVWWLWDGEKEWRIGELDKDQRRLPIRGVWNDTLLVERIVSGWTPENDPT